MIRYVTRQGDVLDLVCYRHYGRRSGVVERVLDHNRDLAGLGPILPIGTVIILPTIPLEATPAATIKLWD